MSMPMRILGNTGLHVSVLSFGFGAWSDSEETTKVILRTARDAGINFFDVAPTQEAEAMFGKLLTELRAEQPSKWRRADIVISAKVGGATLVGDPKACAEQVKESLAGSLRRLQVDFVDLAICYQISANTAMESMVGAMAERVRDGQARFWGTSDLSVQQIMKAHAFATEKFLAAPTFEQPQYNLFSRKKVEVDYQPIYDIPYNFGTISFAPLASGLITTKYLSGTIPEGSRGPRDGARRTMIKSNLAAWTQDGTMEAVELLTSYSSTLKVSVVQLALAWCIRNANVTSVIVGSTTLEQITHNLGAVALAKKMTGADEKALELFIPEAIEGSVRPLAVFVQEENIKPPPRRFMPSMGSYQGSGVRYGGITPSSRLTFERAVQKEVVEVRGGVLGWMRRITRLTFGAACGVAAPINSSESKKASWSVQK